MRNLIISLGRQVTIAEVETIYIDAQEGITTMERKLNHGLGSATEIQDALDIF